MANVTPNRIAELRKAKKMSQQQLADSVGAHWITISKLERGVMQLTSSWLERLAEQLGVAPAELLPKKNNFRIVELFGSIEPGGRVVYFEGATHPVSMPSELDHISMWFEVEGDALWPLFQDGDLLQFFGIENEEVAEYYGRLSLVKLSEDQTVIGFIEAGSSDASVDVRPISAPIRDVKPIEIGIIYEARFTPPWDRLEE